MPTTSEEFFAKPGPSEMVPRGAQYGVGSPQGGEADDWYSEYQRLKTRYAPLWKAIEEDRRYYTLQFGEDAIPKEWKKRGFRSVIPTTAYDAVETAVNHIMTTPLIHVPPRPVGDPGLLDAEVQADNVRYFLEFFWHEIAKQGPRIRQVAKRMIRDGMSAWRLDVDWDRVDFSGMAVGQDQFPWTLTARSATDLLLDDNDPLNPGFLFDTTYLTPANVRRMYPDATKWLDSRRKGDEPIEVVELWTLPKGRDRGKRILWVQGEEVENSHNPYSWVIGYDGKGRDMYGGYLPYVIFDSGWGDPDPQDSTANWFVGIVRRTRSVLENEARTMSAAAAQVRIGTFPVTLMYGIDPQDRENSRIEPGHRIHLATDHQKVEFLQWPEVGASVWQMIERSHRYANDVTKADAMGGQVQRGVDTATEADQNFRNAVSKLSGPLDSLRRGVSITSEWVLMDVEHVLEAPVTLTGLTDGAMTGSITLMPDDIDGFYTVHGDLKTYGQADLDRSLLRLWADVFNVFPVDPEYAMRMAGIQQPRVRIMKRLQYNAATSEQAMQMVIAAQLVQNGGAVGGLMAARMLLGGNDGAGSETPGPEFPEYGLTDGAEAPEAQSPVGQEQRAEGFARALEQTPDVAYS